MSQFQQFSTSTISVSGKVLQQKRIAFNTIIICDGVTPFDNTIPQQTEGTEVITLSINPVSATSVLEIYATIWGTFTTNGNFTMALFRDANLDALSAVGDLWSFSHTQSYNLKFYETSGSVNPTTFKIRIGTNNALLPFCTNSGILGIPIFNGTNYSSFTITEYSS